MMLALVASTFLQLAKPPVFRIERGQGVYLVCGDRRLPLAAGKLPYGWESDGEAVRGLDVGKGRRLRLVDRDGRNRYDLALDVNGKEVGRLDFAALGKAWLAQDELWGGHKAANDLRFVADQSWLSQVLPESGGEPNRAYGVLALQNSRMSAEPIQEQALVLIEIGPPLKATFVRDAGLMSDGFTSVASLRLFADGTARHGFTSILTASTS